MKWHHLTGLAFGIVTITWVFSGLLSMNPGDFNPPRSPTTQEALVFSGKSYTPDDFGLPGPHLLGAHAVEAQLFHYDSRPYFKVTARDGATRVEAGNNGAAMLIIGAEELRSKIRLLNPSASLAQLETLRAYDNYYYSRHPENGGRTLPVVRARFDDDAQTWFHIDPQTGQILERSSRTNRIYRWLYNGLHSFDILWLWERRPLWDILVITFSLGGLVLSIFGVVIGIKRLHWEAT